MGTPPFKDFLAGHPGVQLHTFGDAAAASDGLVINGLDGHNAVAALSAIADRLAGKTLADYAVPTSTTPASSAPGPPPGASTPSSTPATVTASASRFSVPCHLPFHLDLAFDDVQAAEKHLLELGATKPAHQPGGTLWTVLLDPSGQPFCIHATH
ncbi:VOC family protein [Streptomyces sp. HUAS TT7]|uniref:VOC family protein n=1 Tax=Streptomyces sp. HUAS TT7 TaxID=3447507 RepID=UPI003F65BA49